MISQRKNTSVLPTLDTTKCPKACRVRSHGAQAREHRRRPCAAHSRREHARVRHCRREERTTAGVLTAGDVLFPNSLQNNNLGVEGARLIAEALPQCLALQELRYAFEAGGGAARRGAGAWLTAGARNHAPPTRHSLDSNNIGDEGARFIAAALPQCLALKELRYAFEAGGGAARPVAGPG